MMEKFDPEITALVVTDPQNDFLKPGGAFYDAVKQSVIENTKQRPRRVGTEGQRLRQGDAGRDRDGKALRQEALAVVESRQRNAPERAVRDESARSLESFFQEHPEAWGQAVGGARVDAPETFWEGGSTGEQE